MRDVVVLHGGPRLNHARSFAGGRLEEIHLAVAAIHDPGMLARGRPIGAADDAADEEFRVDADFDQLAPRPQREVLAIAAPQTLEIGRTLPDVALVELLDVRRVLAGLQPGDDVVDRADGHLAVALEIL